MDINKQIAERILELRKEKGLTSEKRTSDLSKSCVTYAQKGTFDIKISSIYTITKALDISLAEFFAPFNTKDLTALKQQSHFE